MKIIIIAVVIGGIAICFLTIMALCKVASIADSMYEINFSNNLQE